MRSAINYNLRRMHMLVTLQVSLDVAKIVCL